MLTYSKPEIDHRTIKLIVGGIAFLLPFLTNLLTPSILSISASYFEGGWSQSIFIGSLFAISAFLLAYNGDSRTQMILSKIAACAAFCIAMFPCECLDERRSLMAKCAKDVIDIQGVHGFSAAVMFGILAFFCYVFFDHARAKGHREARWRSIVYAICGLAILAAMLTLTVNYFHNLGIARLTFYGEATGLMAFAVSWLTASQVLPVITAKPERFNPFD
jgi:hypothetical protein